MPAGALYFLVAMVLPPFALMYHFGFKLSMFYTVMSISNLPFFHWAPVIRCFMPRASTPSDSALLAVMMALMPLLIL